MLLAASHLVDVVDPADVGAEGARSCGFVESLIRGHKHRAFAHREGEVDVLVHSPAQTSFDVESRQAEGPGTVDLQRRPRQSVHHGVSLGVAHLSRGDVLPQDCSELGKDKIGNKDFILPGSQPPGGVGVRLGQKPLGKYAGVDHHSH